MTVAISCRARHGVARHRTARRTADVLFGVGCDPRSPLAPHPPENG